MKTRYENEKTISVAYVNKKTVFLSLSLMLLFVLVLAASAGSVRVPFIDTVKIILVNFSNIILKNFGIAMSYEGNAGWESIIYYIRLPRVLLAALVGASLSVSGAVMQGTFRNPMADPGILGASSGAGLGAVSAIALGLTSRGVFYLPLFACIGALAASLIIFYLAVKNGRISVVSLILSGIAVSMFLSSFTTIILMYVRGDQVKQFIFWTVGSFNASRWESIGIIIIPVFLSVTILMFMARKLNVMSLGEEEAQSVGLNPSKTRLIMLVLSSISTAAAVSVSGIISFVGLIIPHILRLIIGPDHRKLIPASALGGAVFLVLCDLIGRTILIPREINAGIVTSFLGAPYLLFLLNRSKSSGGIFGE